MVQQCSDCSGGVITESGAAIMVNGIVITVRVNGIVIAVNM